MLGGKGAWEGPKVSHSIFLFISAPELQHGAQLLYFFSIANCPEIFNFFKLLLSDRYKENAKMQILTLTDNLNLTKGVML